MKSEAHDLYNIESSKKPSYTKARNKEMTNWKVRNKTQAVAHLLVISYRQNGHLIKPLLHS